MVSGTDRALRHRVFPRASGGVPEGHHAICFTDDVENVTAALTAILGTVPGRRAFSWEPGSPALISTILGEDSAGAIEVVPLPARLRGQLTPGTTGISFPVDDLDARVAACRAAGLVVNEVRGSAPAGSGDPSYAVVSVAGLEFELVAVVV